ncbi:hypothetical protein COEREDRAFT_82068 [Coemansia reversa NRRL 1564]|uniref:Uncharacterized protein n=1 Tax=Coemansia reversa (strain ATCC 12441 / NRRL 1564) TaxID=763665 RepID=A0A2G5B8J6_COERN|nr:hypothetical protein COEREDRAFT_82068 [Coemansia reversa NRRL 1564]|eukprot:PIA15310.1 hypothetical protein COEREDRAFT_82068 [Coemansia reversa NRRL 1564]
MFTHVAARERQRLGYAQESAVVKCQLALLPAAGIDQKTGRGAYVIGESEHQHTDDGSGVRSECWCWQGELQAIYAMSVFQNS